VVRIHSADGEEEKTEDKLWYYKHVLGHARQITDTSTVLPLASSPGGHRLGVNGLALDEQASILCEQTELFPRGFTEN
jgi:hypothetical protein